MSEALGKNSGYRRATAIYVSALAFIALIAIGTHVAIDVIIDREADTARVINLAGRQRMLAQRVASLAGQLAFFADRRPDAALEEELHEATRQMMEEHDQLVALPNFEKLAVVKDLEFRVHTYFDLVRTFLALPPAARAESPELDALLAEAHRPLLDVLDSAVRSYQMASEKEVSRLRGGLDAMLAAILVALAAEGALVFRPLFRRLRAAELRLLEAALTDPLTGCRNRRYLMELADHEAERARRTGAPLAVLMIDIDRFKVINDTWGHANGDRAILALADAAVSGLRGGDTVGRIGGEEFAAVLPGTDLESGMAVAEKLRQRIEGLTVPVSGGSFGFTASIGVAVLETGDTMISEAFERADQALYAAKNGGRNRVEGWRPELAPGHSSPPAPADP